MDEIKIDIDEKRTTRQWRRYSYFTGKILARLSIRVLVVNVTSTRKGYHVRMTVDSPKIPAKASYCSLVAIQAILGSDPLREANNLVRVWNGRQDWNKLFREKKSWKTKSRPVWSRERPNRRYTSILRGEIYRHAKKSKSLPIKRRLVKGSRIGHPVRQRQGAITRLVGDGDKRTEPSNGGH